MALHSPSSDQPDRDLLKTSLPTRTCLAPMSRWLPSARACALPRLLPGQRSMPASAAAIWPYSTPPPSWSRSAPLLSVRIAETTPSATAGQSLRTELLAGAAHLRRTPLLAQITLTATVAFLVIGFYESVTFAVIAAIGRPPSFFGV